jgi:hypothetical protein
VALKSTLGSEQKGAVIADELDALEKLLDRTKILYEQYFMGIQKIAPSQLHRTCERKILELTQLQIKNTGLRFRLNTLTQKFGVYNTYWKRTIRQIEQGTYLRDIARVKRKAEAAGEDLPEEVLAAMPKRMREQILRGRDLAARKAERTGATAAGGGDEQTVRKPRSNVHSLDPSDIGDLDDLDLDALFDQITDTPTKPAAPRPAAARAAPARPQPPPRPPATPAPAAAKPPPVPRAAPRPAPTRAGGTPPGMTEAQVRDLHRKYNQARKLVGEKGEVSYDKLMRTISSQAPRIMQQHKASGVEFNVVVKEDKVILKAKPKK